MRRWRLDGRVSPPACCGDIPPNKTPLGRAMIGPKNAAGQPDVRSKQGYKSPGSTRDWLSASDVGSAGIWYLPSSQRPRSISLQRSLQNGKCPLGWSACGSATGFLQIGQFTTGLFFSFSRRLGRRCWGGRFGRLGLWRFALGGWLSVAGCRLGVATFAFTT